MRRFLNRATDLLQVNLLSGLVRRGLWVLRHQGPRRFTAKLYRKVKNGVRGLAHAAERGNSTHARRNARTRINYGTWIAENEPDSDALERQRRRVTELQYRPKISVIVPVFDPQGEVLEDMVESIRAQTYENWELCIASASRGNDAINSRLARYSQEDARIKFTLLDENLGIAGNSNRALQLATGEYLALVDQDDTLAPFAFFGVASRLQEDRLIDVIYSDHDYVAPDGKTRLQPLFKPDWSPEVMLSANYMTHLTVLRTSIVRDVGGFRTDMDGAQDWDLFFKVVERTDRIAHIPGILYHWRTSDTSTAANRGAKPYAAAAQLRAISRHLKAEGLPEATAFFEESGRIRVRWRSPAKKISIIILTRGLEGPLKKCVKSILKKTIHPHFEMLVINNGRQRPEQFAYFGELREEPRVRVLHQTGAFNYSAANNYGVAECTGEYLVFLNNDTEVLSGDWLDELAMWASWAEIGAVGAKLLRANGRIQHAGVVVGMGGLAGHVYAGAQETHDDIFGSTEWYRDYSALTGACLMMRRGVFEEIGGFNEDFILNGSDVELGLRLQKAGLRAVYNPFVRLRHVEAATHQGNIPEQDFKTSLVYYRDALIRGDRYFNPNLSRYHSIPTYRPSNEEGPLDRITGFRGALPSVKTGVGARAITEYSVEAGNIASWFDASPEEIAASRALQEGNAGELDIRSVGWFIPEFSNPFYGGIHTILRFANFLRLEKGVDSHFFLTGSTREKRISQLIASAFPALADNPVEAVMISDDWEKKAPTDAVICTLWSTAYYALKFNKTKRKFYFIQDYEPLFYPAGSVYGQVEATYRFGYYGLANTPTLKNIYEQQYGGVAEFFLPGVDTDMYHPGRSIDAGQSRRRHTVFFYGRPGHARNGFELGAAASKLLKKRLGARVAILCAGAEWRPEDHGLQGVLDNLGILTLKQAAALYRTCDAGLVMMFTKHPSYLPFELMASGCLVVTNKNRATEWLLEDGVNCLLTEATPSCIAETLERGLMNDAGRERIVRRARSLVESRFSSWDEEMEKMYGFMCGPKDKGKQQ